MSARLQAMLDMAIKERNAFESRLLAIKEVFERLDHPKGFVSAADALAEIRAVMSKPQ